MAALGTHPRLAHMLLASRDLGCSALACDLAAILSERDLLRGPGAASNVDVALRVDLLHGAGAAPPGAELDRGARARAQRLAQSWKRELGARDEGAGRGTLEGVLLALAYPDRIGAGRGDGRFLLSGGRGAFLREAQALSRQPFIVAAELDAGEREARIFLAASLTRADIDRYLAPLTRLGEVIRWDSAEGAVVARQERRLGALLLDQLRLENPDPGRVLAAMLEGVGELGLAALPFSRAATGFRARAEFVRRHVHTEGSRAARNSTGWTCTRCSPHASRTRSARTSSGSRRRISRFRAARASRSTTPIPMRRSWRSACRRSSV
jgi:ATP-dependent helicase HrpB